MNKKKLGITIGSIMAVFVFILSFAIFKNNNFNTSKLKGDVSATGTATVSCSATSLEVNGTTTCTVSGSISAGNLQTIVGSLSATNLEILSVSPNTSIFSQTSQGNNIYYVAGANEITGSFTIATVSVKATTAGSGSLTFTPRYYRVSGTTVNISAGNAGITINSATPQPSSNANLGSLSVTGASIGTFNPNTTSYGANVANSVTSVTINATAADSHATISGTGNKTLNVGNNSFQIVVTAENRTTTKTYTVNINRASGSISTNNNIGSITVTNGSSVVNIGTVSATKTTYTATVANNVSSVNVAATAADSNAQVTGNLGNQNLYVGLNTLVINVKSQSGSTKTYTIKITRSSSSGGGSSTLNSTCTLSKLAVSGTGIANNFSPTVYSYKASVKNNVSSVTITATPTNNKANVKGTGIKTLNVGNNSFNIEVTAENGNKKVYNVVIVREGNGSGSSGSNSGNNSSGNNGTKTETKKDNNALLKELIVDNTTMTLTEDNFSYNYTVLYEVTSVKVKATPASDKAKVKVVGNDNLQVGKNTIMITVTAEDGSEKIYLVNVTKKEQAEKLSNDSKLTNLSIKGYDINFDPAVHTYTVKIKNEKQLNIDYSASNSNSNVVITGNENLKNNSVITVEVTAEDGTISKYEIKVKKQGSSKMVIIGVSGIAFLGLLGAALFLFVFKKKDKKEPEEPQEIASFSQADVYDEYVKNTTVPKEATTNGYITEEAAMVAEPENTSEEQNVIEDFNNQEEPKVEETPIENPITDEIPVEENNSIDEIPVENTTEEPTTIETDTISVEEPVVVENNTVSDITSESTENIEEPVELPEVPVEETPIETIEEIPENTDSTEQINQ